MDIINKSKPTLFMVNVKKEITLMLFQRNLRINCSERDQKSSVFPLCSILSTVIHHWREIIELKMLLDE